MTKKEAAQLIDQVSHYINRLIEEQIQTTQLLRSCERHHYFDQSNITQERERLEFNINIDKKSLKGYHELLLDLIPDTKPKASK